jgi:hypothetical protein
MDDISDLLVPATDYDRASTPAADGLGNLAARGEHERAETLRRAIEETKASLGPLADDLWHIALGRYDFLFVPPNEGQYGECTGKAAEKLKNSPILLRQLALQIVKWPDVQTLRVIFAKRTGIPAKIAQDALSISAEEAPEHAKKV